MAKKRKVKKVPKPEEDLSEVLFGNEVGDEESETDKEAIRRYIG